MYLRTQKQHVSDKYVHMIENSVICKITWVIVISDLSFFWAIVVGTLFKYLLQYLVQVINKTVRQL